MGKREVGKERVSWRRRNCGGEGERVRNEEMEEEKERVSWRRSGQRVRWRRREYGGEGESEAIE